MGSPLRPVLAGIIMVELENSLVAKLIVICALGNVILMIILWQLLKKDQSIMYISN